MATEVGVGKNDLVRTSWEKVYTCAEPSRPGICHAFSSTDPTFHIPPHTSISSHPYLVFASRTDKKTTQPETVFIQKRSKHTRTLAGCGLRDLPSRRELEPKVEQLGARLAGRQQHQQHQQRGGLGSPCFSLGDFL